mgnify:CR=1 FL=1
MLAAAYRYLHAGLCVLPALRVEKRPAVPGWKQFQNALPSESQLAAWFQDAEAICLVCGTVSGNLELLDFDLGGEAFESWREQVRQAGAGLLDRLVVERSQSGGRHVAYRCRSPVCGNLKLAQRVAPADGPDEVTISGKRYKPRQDANGRWQVVLTAIETRGEGGLFLCSPTPDYTLVQGDFDSLPVLTEAERELLLEAAYSLNQYLPEPIATPVANGAGSRPGDDFNRRGDVRGLLVRHGWQLVRGGGENEYWRRPGKSVGWSATLKDGVFYVFSSSAAPFEPGQAYAPFAVYALLEHHGNFAAAAAELRQQGFGDDSACWSLLQDGATTSVREPDPPDPGPTPSELLRVPGFVSEVLDYTLEIAPHPNQAMAFAGALALQAVLAGRKVRDPGDNRTNIYLLGLANPGVGKDHPRKVNASILYAAGLASCLGQSFASGEGIQDALYRTPSLLFQTDEFDTILQALKKDRDGRHESILATLLTLYSAANSVFPMRRRAEQRSQTKKTPLAAPEAIDQPCLVIFGTAIPKYYYEALSERTLTNGLFARMVIVEAGTRSKWQQPGVISPPKRVVETARWWAEYRPGGDLSTFRPVPAIVEQTKEAQIALAEACEEIDAEYSRAESCDDPVGTTVWGRVSEHVRKLALLYAISEDCRRPSIGAAAVKWAATFAIHNARRMLAMAARHAADNPVCAIGLKILEKLKAAPGQSLPHSVLLKRMKIDAKSFCETIRTLVERGDVAIEERGHDRGRPATCYSLAENAEAGGERNG